MAPGGEVDAFEAEAGGLDGAAVGRTASKARRTKLRSAEISSWRVPLGMNSAFAA